MHTNKTMRRWAILTALTLCALAPISARAVSDRPGSLVDFPYLRLDSAAGIDTVIELTNSSTLGLNVKCYLEDLNRHCTSDLSQVCSADAECPSAGTCVQGASMVDFDLALTPGQPVGWRLGNGLAALNAGVGHIPPAAEDPFLGRLQCFAVDGSDAPTVNNSLRGAATIERYQASPTALDAAKYNGIGFEGITNNGDPVLRFDDLEYESCPNINIVHHAFENAVDPVTGTSRIHTRFVVVPCTLNPSVGDPGRATVYYLIFNEFEQRLTVRQTIEGIQAGRLPSIDPLAFDAAMQGTLTGQTRISAAGGLGNVIAVAVEEQESIADPSQVASAASNVYQQGSSFNADAIDAGSAPVCGNGSVEAGEQCDDGNLAAGDGCGADCLIEPCARVQQPFMGYCIPAGGLLQISNNATNDNLDKLNLTTTVSTDLGAFENPALATDYTLCLFDDSNLVMSADLSGAGTCGTKPCWKQLGPTATRRGFRYHNASTNSDGVFLTKLVKKTTGVKLIFKAKGANVSLPVPVSATKYFNQNMGVAAVLVDNASGECFETDFFSNTRNTPTSFVANQ